MRHVGMTSERSYVYKGHHYINCLKPMHFHIRNIMKPAYLVLAVLGTVAGRPQQNPRDAYITRYDNDVSDPGFYSFNVETSDGFKHEQQGALQNAGTENESLVVRGSYSYVGPDGVTYTVIYIADENGFQPEGEHIPPSAGVKKLGLASAAQASLVGGGLG